MIPVAAAAKTCGLLGYLALSGWVLREDLGRLLVGNVCALLDQVATTLGASGTPGPTTVALALGGLLVVNAAGYATLCCLLCRAVGLPGGQVGRGGG